MDRNALAELLQALESRRDAEERRREERYTALIERHWIEHLKEHSSDQPAAVNVWKKQRMDRMMVEHLLRCGYYSTAVKLARQSGIEVGIATVHGLFRITAFRNICNQSEKSS
ncbi:UNVERIFIED_CONTAM: hypothetical protein FKN15_053142 [Acipenser sinensis]